MEQKAHVKNQLHLLYFPETIILRLISKGLWEKIEGNTVHFSKAHIAKKKFKNLFLG